MKNLILLVILSCFTYFFVIYVNGNEYKKTSNSITICVDSTCTETKMSCVLYDIYNNQVGNCGINQLYTNCCTVDSVQYPASYYWKVVTRSQTCTGSPFQYNGGQLTINFSCDSCQ